MKANGKRNLRANIKFFTSHMQIGTLNPGFESRWQVKTAAGSVNVTASRRGDQNLTLHLNLTSYLIKIKLNGRSKKEAVTDDDSHSPINQLLPSM